MVKIKLPALRSKTSHSGMISEENNQNNTTNNGPKLWDNEDLVLTALKVYGRHPRPQCFNEISRVCKLSNLRKSRYFHEKMMKNNPYEDKIRKLIAEEGEEAYPFFKIFFEEYKTKKERQKLMSQEDKYSMSNGNSGIIENNSEDVELFESSINNEEFDVNLSKGIKLNESYEDASDICVEYGINNAIDEYGATSVNTEFEIGQNYLINDQITSLINSNSQYLENLELKLKILNKEKQTVVEFFENFSACINNLNEKIYNTKTSLETFKSIKANNITDQCNNKDSKEANLSKLINRSSPLKSVIYKIKDDLLFLDKQQAKLKEDLKLTSNYVHIENFKLQDDLNISRNTLNVKNDQVIELKRQLENSIHQNRKSTSKHLSIQSNFNVTKLMFNDMKESLDRVFSQIHSLS